MLKQRNSENKIKKSLYDFAIYFSNNLSKFFHRREVVGHYPAVSIHVTTLTPVKLKQGTVEYQLQ
jgi:hypothetical protein